MKRRLLFVISTCFFGFHVLNAAEFCAVKVFVRSSEDIPLTLPVQLLNASGELINSFVSEDGVTEICDLDFGDHTIVVGRDSCGQTTLRHVRLCYGKVQQFHVTISSCPCAEQTLLKCPVYFRVMSEGKQKLPGVSVRSESAVVGVTDQFGRTQIVTGLGESTQLTFSKPGFESVTMKLNCSVPAQMERAVVLAPVKP